MRSFVIILILCYVNLVNSQDKFEYYKIDFQRNFVVADTKGVVNIEESEITINPIDNARLINERLVENRIVKLPNLEILVDENGITLNNKNVLIFDKETSINIIENSAERYEVLRIHNVEDVEVYNPTSSGRSF